MTPRGKQIRLFYTTGQHNGVIRADLFGWTGYVYSAPRSAMHLLEQDADALEAGVYFLLSRSDGQTKTAQRLTQLDDKINAVDAQIQSAQQ